MPTLKIAVGSHNPTKVDAVRAVCSRAFPAVEIIPISVPSGVSEQPMGQDETLTGARNRAAAAMDAVGADMGAGLEGGAVETPWGMFTMGWVVLVDREGREGLSQSPWLQLPPPVAAAVADGGELGPVIDRFSGESNTKEHGGAVGFLTNNLFDRRTAWEMSVAYALAPFLKAELYGAKA